MNKIELLTQSFVKQHETIEAYWEDLEKLAFQLVKSFGSYLGVDRTRTFLDGNGEHHRYLEIGVRKNNNGEEFTVASRGDDLPGKDGELFFTIRLVFEAPENPNYKVAYYFDFSTSRTSSSYATTFEVDGDEFRHQSDRSSPEDHITGLCNLMEESLLKALDDSAYK